MSWSRFLSRFLRLSSLMEIDKIHQDLLRNLSIIKTCWKTSGSKVSTNLEISTKIKGKIEYILIEIKNNWKSWKILKNRLLRQTFWNALRQIVLLSRILQQTGAWSNPGVSDSSWLTGRIRLVHNLEGSSSWDRLRKLRKGKVR